MADYIEWADVIDVMPRAGDVISATADQTTEMNLAEDLADEYLAPLMQVPVVVDSSGDYPAFVRRFTALLCADMVASRRQTGDDDQTQVEYDGHVYTGTIYGHKAMGMLAAKRQAKLALDSDVTVPEAVKPYLITSFTTTTGIVEAKYSAGFFEDDKRGVFRFTISSTDGTVAGDDLEVTCVRDADDTVLDGQTIMGGGWYHVAYGLLVRFTDPASAAVWTEDETFTITCEAQDANVLTDGVGAVEWDLS